MGLSRRDHILASGLELGAILLLSYSLGAVLALPVGRALAVTLDPLPSVPPGPIFTVPLAPLIGAASMVILISLGATWLLSARARAVNLGELTRLAE